MSGIFSPYTCHCIAAPVHPCSGAELDRGAEEEAAGGRAGQALHQRHPGEKNVLYLAKHTFYIRTSTYYYTRYIYNK